MAEYPKVLAHFGITVVSADEELALSDGRAVILHDGERRLLKMVEPKHHDPRGKAHWEANLGRVAREAQAAQEAPTTAVAPVAPARRRVAAAKPKAAMARRRK